MGLILAAPTREAMLCYGLSIWLLCLLTRVEFLRHPNGLFFPLGYKMEEKLFLDWIVNIKLQNLASSSSSVYVVLPSGAGLKQRNFSDKYCCNLGVGSNPWYFGSGDTNCNSKKGTSGTFYRNWISLFITAIKNLCDREKPGCHVYNCLKFSISCRMIVLFKNSVNSVRLWAHDLTALTGKTILKKSFNIFLLLSRVILFLDDVIRQPDRAAGIGHHDDGPGLHSHRRNRFVSLMISFLLQGSKRASLSLIAFRVQIRG